MVDFSFLDEVDTLKIYNFIGLKRKIITVAGKKRWEILGLFFRGHSKMLPHKSPTSLIDQR